MNPGEGNDAKVKKKPDMKHLVMAASNKLAYSNKLVLAMNSQPEWRQVF